MTAVSNNEEPKGDPESVAKSSAFAITTPTPRVELDRAQQGNVSFTITNTSGRALRAQTQIVAQQPAQDAWLQLDATGELDFPVGSTQQLLAKISVPVGATPGQYSFRVDAMGVANPDEDYAVGPSVAFEVPPPPPAEAKKPFPWWIVAVAAAVLVLIVGGVVAYLQFFRTPDVNVATSPSFGGVTLSNVSVNGGGNVAQVAAGATINVTMEYFIQDPGCPGCVDQIEVGFATQAPLTCVYSGVPGAAGVRGAERFTATAPNARGVYYLGFDRAQHFSCGQAIGGGAWWNGPPDASRHFAAVIVQ